MRPGNTSHLAWYRFAYGLKGAPFVQPVHGLMLGSERHVSVVLREQTREARHAVYTAQLQVDPDFLLTLHFVESRSAVPPTPKPLH